MPTTISKKGFDFGTADCIHSDSLKLTATSEKAIAIEYAISFKLISFLFQYASALF